MLRLIIIFSIIGLSLGCKKGILDEKPKNFISTVNFYGNATDAEAVVRGMFAEASANPFRGQFIEVHSDFATGRGSWTSVNDFSKVLDQAQIGRAANFLWNPYYRVINRANSILENVPQIDMDETKKKTFLGEAYLMRAWSYFDLVRGFGPVPLRTSAIKDLASIAAPRASEEEVYDLIINDLTIAETDLPNSVGENTRRGTKWAAKMLLAQVYLTIERWGDAAAKAEEVINSGMYSLIEVQQPEDFYQIFAVSTSAEDIMSAHYSSILQDDYVLTLHRPSIPVYNSGSTGFFTTVPVMNSFLGTWDDDDLRKRFNLYSEYVDANGNVVSLPALTPVLFKKFIAQPDGIRGNSRPVFRLGEAYLIYAEAAAMAAGAPTPQALERLNVIKRRGYGYDPYSPSPVDFASGMAIQEFRDIVIQERAYELLHEQRRWWDLVRTGKAKEKIEAAYGQPFIDARLLFPIPEDEINNNPMINQADQNPGY